MNRKIGTALVVGGGISGIRASLDLANFGYGVTLIDRSPGLGGILGQLDYQFPTDRCGMCKMLPLADRDASSQFCLRKGLFHENIDILLATQLTALEGEPGKFRAILKRTPNPVDPERCIGCGKCVDVCPVEVADAFNAGLGKRKAIYLPVPHAIPNPYRIDMATCTQCGECRKVCPTDAIHLVDEARKAFRILVVDDELIVRDSLKEWLAVEGGFSVEMAESGPDALEKLRSDTFHLMLLDIKMPGMDGVEVLQRAKEMLPELTVVMMTAYATVETAVEAMKIGAMEYLIKPFDPDQLIPRIVEIYDRIFAPSTVELHVGAVVLSAGNAYFNPADGVNSYGYGEFPDVVTSLEFERIVSGTGPFGGRLTRPSDGKPVRKIAWLQCIGSREIQTDAAQKFDGCSNVCCMYAIKEAMIATERAGAAGHDLDAAIYYMDMRTFGKPFQKYRDRAEEAGVRFVRGRVHSVTPDRKSGRLELRFADLSGGIHEETTDMVVLSVGQRPANGAAELAEMVGIGLNPWGFPETEPFSLSRTAREGVTIGGAFGGLKEISESVVHAGSAALGASRVIHGAGGSLKLEKEGAETLIYEDVSRQLARILAVICTCEDAMSGLLDPPALTRALKRDPAVNQVLFLDHVCTADGWKRLTEAVKNNRPNRLLIGACLPYVYARKLKSLGRETGLDPRLMDVVDIRTSAFRTDESGDPKAAEAFRAAVISELRMSAARLKRAEAFPVATVPVQQKALVVGGGIAGMSAALAIADHGYPVVLVEKGDKLGGNVNWVKHTIEGHATGALLEETVARVTGHPEIEVHMGAKVLTAMGEVGRFMTTIEDSDGKPRTIIHGAAILATGGREAATTSYGYGTSAAIVTQKEFEQKLDAGEIDAAALKHVVMIQCVDSREGDRNYCSRVCCPTMLKQALRLKTENPKVEIFTFYRDMMSCGFTESYFTEARKKKVHFIQYSVDRKPEVTVDGERVMLRGYEPILGRDVEISPDVLVLATGISPELPGELAEAYGAGVDEDGFFQEADFKWRPVDSLKAGVYACGIALSPRNITESIAAGEAAAQRALGVLCRNRLPAGKIVADVRHTLCSLCERCIGACPYHARSLDTDKEKIVVNPAMCQGCGACAAICPNGASYIEGYPAAQMLEMIDAAVA